MTYTEEITKKRNQDIGFYFKFEGVKELLSTHNFNGILAGDFIESVAVESISNISNSLDRQLSFIEPSGCSFQVIDSPQIRQFFLRKGGVERTINADFGVFDTSLQVADMGLSIGDLIYLDRETLVVTAAHSGGAYNVTRAAYDSVAVAHIAGAVASTRPRHWLTRNCTFYAVDLKTNFTSVLGIYFLSESPKFNDGKWNINLVDLLAKLAAPIFKGWKEQESTDISDGGSYMIGVEGSSNLVDIYVENMRDFSLNSDFRGHIKVSFDKYWGVFELLTLNSINTRITICFSHILASNFGSDFSKSKFKKKLLKSKKCTVKLVYYFSGQLNFLANLLLHSSHGDAQNGYYDQLAGEERVTKTGIFDSSEKRIGAGIPQVLVDSESFKRCSQDQISIFIDEQTPLVEFFSNEILWRSGGYLHVNNLGKIAFQRYAPLTIRNNATNLTDSSILQTTTNSIDDESTQISRAVFESNYHPELGFLKSIEVLFSDDEATLGDNRAELSFKSRGIWVGGVRDGMLSVAVTDFLQIQVYLERMKQRQASGGHKITLKLPWQLSEAVKIGTKVKVTDSTLPSHTDSGSLKDVFFEVVGNNFSVESGEFNVELEAVQIGVLVCPSFEVLSYDVGAQEITVNNAGNLGTGVLYSGSAVDDIGAGWEVRIYFAATNFETYEDNVTLTSTVDFIPLRNAPIVNPSAGDIITIRDGIDSGNLNRVNADIQDFAFGADASLKVGSGAYRRDGGIWG